MSNKPYTKDLSVRSEGGDGSEDANDRPYMENLLFKYLLGDLPENKRQELEERYFADDDLYDELLAAERDLIDAYVEGSLLNTEREQFESHFLCSPSRQQKLKFATALREHLLIARRKAVPPARVKPKRELSAAPIKWALAASLVLMIVAGYFAFRRPSTEPDVSEAVNTMRRSNETPRLLQARIRGFEYAPWSRERGAQSDVEEDRRDLELILRSAARSRSDAASYHNLGQFYLFDGKIDLAIANLAKALELNPSDAGIYSDWGAALFEKGKSYEPSGDLEAAQQYYEQSLQVLSKAIDMDDSLIEALFNRALLYQHQKLWQQAEADWNRYLQKDSSSPWAEDARLHLRDIPRRSSKNKDEVLQDFMLAFQAKDDYLAWRLLTRNREPVSGIFICRQLIGAHIERLLSGGDEQADRYLKALDYAGQMEAQKTGDRYTAELAAFYRSLPGGVLPKLAEAHKLIDKGHQLCRDSKYAEALDSFRDARLIFHEAGDRWEASFVEYWIGYCQLQKTDTQGSLTTLERLARRCEANNYRWLLAQALNSLANVKTTFNEYSLAIEHTNRALEIAEQIEDAYGIQKNLAQLANEYKYVGNYQQALTHLHRCLKLSEADWVGARQMWRTYDTAAQVHHHLGLPAIAVAYEREALNLALAENDPSCIFVSYVHLGLALGELRRFPEAIRLAQSGYETGERLREGDTRQKIMAYSSLMLGHLYRRADNIAEAIYCYDRAIKMYKALNYGVHLYNAHKGRLLCYNKRRNDALVKNELMVVLRLFDKNNLKIFDETNKNKFLDTEQNVYDAAIDLQYTRFKDSRKAFDYSEDSRARSLLHLMRFGAKTIRAPVAPGAGFAPLKLAQVRRRLPDEVQILQYAALDDKLLIWVISKGTYIATHYNITLKELNSILQEYFKLVSTPDTRNLRQIASEAARLYEILIAPVKQYLDPQKQVCVIPDKMLYHLQFDTLISPASGKYLINDYTVFWSPSSTILILCSDGARKKARQSNESFLSIGNPAVNREEFPSLEDLPSAAEEAQIVKGYYHPARLFTGKDATEAAVKSAMKVCDVIHLASHYVPEEKSPMDSKLPLGKDPAGGDKEDGVLQAAEVNAMKPLKARLVVLSACKTGVERYYNGEGMIGLTRPFIAAGVPLVVASLWKADSYVAKELMVSFHRYRKQERRPTVEALRQSKLDMLSTAANHYTHPYYWAPFTAFGGYAAY